MRERRVAYEICPLRASLRDFSSRLAETKTSGPMGLTLARVRALFTRSRVTLRLPAEKVSGEERAVRLHGRAWLVCARGHPRAPISIIHPDPPWFIRPWSRGDMRQQHGAYWAHISAHMRERERERARASRDRGGKFHSRIHSLANRFPAWVEYIEIIWANTTSSVMKFAEGLASSRLSCLRLSVPISPSPPLLVPFPPHFASHSSSSARSNPTLLLYLFVLALSSSSSRPPLAPSPSSIANLPEWYLLKIGSIATWVFACSSYTFRLPLSYNIYTRAVCSCR